MNLIPCDRNEIRKFYKKTKLQSILEQFAESEYDCARVDGAHYSCAAVGAQTINRSINHFRFYGIRAISSRGQVYLIKEREDES